MSDNPFFRPNNRNDWIFVANAALALASDDFGELERAFASLGPGTTQHFPRDNSAPDVFVYVSADQVVVVIQGTEGAAEWVGQILGSFQVPEPTMVGKATSFDVIAGRSILSKILPILAPVIRDHRIVLMGHSLGGALAQVVGNQIASAAEAGISILTIGAPRVGDPTFATYIGGVVQRLETVNDPIVNIPPVNWAGLGSHFPIPGTGPAQTFEHAGTAYQLDASGHITAGSQDMPLEQIVEQLVTASTPTHAASYYLQALEAQSDLASQKPGDQGYADPPALWASTQAQQNLPPFRRFTESGSIMSDLIQGTLFFRDTGVSEGFSENIYLFADVPACQTFLASLLVPRSAFLGNDVEIHAYRSSIVGATKGSKVVKLAVPQRGQYNDTTNEVGDAILYLAKSATNPKRIMTFRGVPDGSIAGDKLTPLGVALTGSIDAYMNMLIAGNACMKTVSTLGLGKQQIQAIANLVPGGPIGITTVNPHGLSDGDIINLQGIRGFPYLLGRWKIQVTGASTIVLNGSERYNITLGRVGTIELVDYVATQITTFGFDSVGHRNTGRPFGQPRGRRPRKVLHQ